MQNFLELSKDLKNLILSSEKVINKNELISIRSVVVDVSVSYDKLGAELVRYSVVIFVQDEDLTSDKYTLRTFVQLRDLEGNKLCDFYEVDKSK